MNPQRPSPSLPPLDAVVRAVSSKSVTHRALVAAALADGVSTIVTPLVADDTRVTRAGLEALGIEIGDADPGWTVRGCDGAVPGGGRLELGESGTSFRFLVALASLGQAPSTLDGSPRLRERPVAELADALRGLGATIEPRGESAGLPLRAGGSPLRGGRVVLAAQRSSQFASALLLIGPCLPGGLELLLRPPAVSLPYIELTARVMQHFGVDVERRDDLRWSVAAGRYSAMQFVVEGDHSAASYFLAAPAVAAGRVRVTGLDPSSAQPDARLGAILERLGCRVNRGPDWIEVSGDGKLNGFELDAAAFPDLVPTLAVLGMFAAGPSRIEGIAHLRLKESDRLELLAHNLRRIGRPASALDDALEIGPPAALHGAKIVTAGDHRMAMAFALASLRVDGVEPDDRDCVAKSNPGFWEQFERLRT